MSMKESEIISGLRAGAYDDRLSALYGGDRLEAQRDRWIGAAESFADLYGDMDGKSIHESLYQNDDGDWIIERRAREDFESPMIVTTYLLTEADVNDFASFIKDNNVCGLEDRPDSDLFITDYSAWDYGIEYDNTSVGGDRWVTYSIWEYKEYSDEDMALLDELDKRFKDLHYNMISEIEEEDD